ncbi:MAG: TonB-dependent receptor plug domain-containing protein, partial [Pseudomonadales bacterium]
MLSVLICSAVHVNAQPLAFAPELSPANNRLLEHVVVTASPAPTALKRLPASISLLDRDALGRIGHRHIAEALERVPGANISRGSGQEYLPALRSPVLSGAGACGSLLVAENGVPLRAAGFCNVNELFEAQSETARAIELVRGPAQTAYGSNAVHGVVNVLTPQPGDAQLLALEAGEEDFYRFKAGVNATQQL